jgi:hypothetical protein
MYNVSGIVSSRGTIFLSFLSATRRLRETRHCVGFVDTPVTDVRIRKKSIISLGLSLEEEHILASPFFYDVPCGMDGLTAS